MVDREELGSVACEPAARLASPSLNAGSATPSMENGPALWAAILRRFPPGAIVAGGAVRDYLLGVEPKDIDVFFEVMTYEPLAGFYRLGADCDAEYSAMPSIYLVQRGRIDGYVVDAVGVWFEDEDYRPQRIVETFDFGISRCWFDGVSINDTPEAQSDRDGKTVSCLIADRPQRALPRFARFNERMGGQFTLIGLPEDGSQTPVTSDGEGKSEGLMPTEPNTSVPLTTTMKAEG